MKARRYVAVWSMLVLLSVMLPVTVKASEETRKKIDQAEQEEGDGVQTGRDGRKSG